MEAGCGDLVGGGDEGVGVEETVEGAAAVWGGEGGVVFGGFGGGRVGGGGEAEGLWYVDEEEEEERWEHLLFLCFLRYLAFWGFT